MSDLIPKGFDVENFKAEFERKHMRQWDFGHEVAELAIKRLNEYQFLTSVLIDQYGVMRAQDLLDEADDRTIETNIKEVK